MDTIGRITVPTPVRSGLVFPLSDARPSSASPPIVHQSEFPYGESRPTPVVYHRFGDLATLAVQSFIVGLGPRRFHFQRSALSYQDRIALLGFYEQVEGSFQSFTYNAPNSDRATTTPYEVIFDTPPLSLDHLANSCRTGLTFVECPTASPTYFILGTDTRFPSANSGLATALSSTVQEIIPLIHIKVRDTTASPIPDIYLSDRRCTVGNFSYLPRVIGIGDAGSDVLMSQSITGAADDIQLQFGNADRAMTMLANDCDLRYASIDISLYHIQSQVLLQLWKGFIQNYVSDGTPVFQVQCSDGLYPITQQYPNRRISHFCWKTFNDGVNCPYGSFGRGGDPNSCDYTFDGPNGCQAHGMSPPGAPDSDYYVHPSGDQTHITDPNGAVPKPGFFGGVRINPQGVFIKDNSTGFLGFQRNRVTAVSVVSDSIWNRPLPEIFVNAYDPPGNLNNTHGQPISQSRSMPVNALVADVRDESPFLDALGIVGAGPVGEYAGMSLYINDDGYHQLISPLLDGFPPQGLNVDLGQQIIRAVSNLGLREVSGQDPAVVEKDTFYNNQKNIGLPINQTVTVDVAPSMSLGHGDKTQAWGPQVSGGIALAEIRIQKDSNIRPSTPDQHQMQIPVLKGLSGRIWNTSGGSSWVDGLTNPFWVAINCYLRAIGLTPRKTDDGSIIAKQFASFVLPTVQDGSGPADIADLLVTPLTTITGTSYQEKQFTFQGVLDQPKPFRDWLVEILSCALGYFVFEFGKLRLGIRENASAAAAFTVGNMLFQSLRLEPAQPLGLGGIAGSFESLRIDFANAAIAFQADYAEYTDKSHATFYGRQDAPLTAQMHSVGMSNMSQALRVAATRAREEMGGVNESEWMTLRTATWRTTILALDTYVGQVVSITHPDCPNGVSKFRILKWTLHKDWSVTIQGRTVTPSMYDLDFGPKPTDVQPTPLPILFYPQPQGVWAPFETQAPATDALFPSEWNFALLVSNQTLADNTNLTSVRVTGRLPVNSFIPGVGTPTITLGGVTRSTGGGSIAGGTAWRVVVCAADANGHLTPPSDVVIVQIPSGTNTNSFTIGGIRWPTLSGVSFAGYVAFISNRDDLICAMTPDPVTELTGTGTPDSITFTGPFARSTWGAPDDALALVRIKSKLLLHGGVLGGQVKNDFGPSVSGTTLVSGETVDTSGIDNWTGRVLAIIGRDGDTTPWLSFNITAFDASTGTFTLDQDVGAAGVQDLDVFVVCFLGYDNSATPTIIQDSKLLNANSPVPRSGLIPNYEAGCILRVIKGTNRGATSKIISNDSISWTLADPITIDSTSVWIIEEPTWRFSADSTSFANSDFLKETNITTDVQNFVKQPLLIAGYTVTADGVESGDADAPMRMGYTFGKGGVVLDRPYTWDIWDSTTNAPILPIPVRNFSVPFELVVTIKDSPATNCSIDILVQAPYQSGLGWPIPPLISILPAPFVIPANTSGQTSTVTFSFGIPSSAQLSSAMSTWTGGSTTGTVSQWNYVLQNVVPVTQWGGVNAIIVTSSTFSATDIITASQYYNLLLALHPNGIILHGPTVAGGLSDTLNAQIVSGDGTGTFTIVLSCALIQDPQLTATAPFIGAARSPGGTRTGGGVATRSVLGTRNVTVL